MTDLPNPTPADQASEEFQAIWGVIKTWDLAAPPYHDGYCGANGSHVKLILDALKESRSKQGVEVVLVGEEPDSSEPIEASVRLAAVPSKDDTIVAWVNGDRPHSGNEVHATVVEVAHHAWQFDHDPGPQAPRVAIIRQYGSDAEWLDFFKALNEGQRP